MQDSKLASVLKYGLYAVALMPLIIFKEYLSPFHFGKVVIFRAWIEILAVFYLFLIFKDRSYLPKTNPIFWAVTIFTAIFGLTTLTGADIYQSFWGTLERMGGWFTYFHFWMFFVMAVGVLKKQEDWITFLKISVVTSFISTLYGFLQKTDIEAVVGSGGRSRIFGTIGNPALFAGYELLNVFFALLLAFWKKISKNGRAFYAVIMLVNLIAIFSTAVRGSLLAAVVALGLFSFFYTYLGGAQKWRRLMIGGVALLIILEGILILNHNASFVQNSPYLSRLSDASLSTRTVNTRFWAWESGIDGWNDSLKTIVVGWGPENFNLPFSKHFNPKFYLGPGSETLFDRGHNMFVEVLVTMGLIGFLSYLWVFGVLSVGLRKVFKHAKSSDEKVAAASLSAGLAAYIIHNAFIFDTSANLMMFFLAAGFIYSLVQSLVPAEETTVKAKRVPWRVTAFPAMLTIVVASILVIFSIHQTSIKPALANYASTRGIVASWGGKNNEAVNKFEEALAYNTFGEYEIRHRYTQFVLENISKFPAEERADLLLGVIDHAKKNIHAGDKDYLPYLYISRSYILLGRGDPKSPYNDLALDNSLHALSIAPDFIRTYFEVGQAYLNKKEFAKAGEYFEKAAKLNPDVGISYWYWAATVFDTGDLDRALELVDLAEEKGYVLTDADYLRILAVYSQKNNYKRVAEIYEVIVIERGSNIAQYSASLAATYQKIGNIDGAEKMARRAAELDPSFESEAKSFIESLGRKY
ncbi:MAG: tetratricopeptide repeat protein [bacterium]|nr:tetratricopeptide repeat protein [bacterium]